MLRLIAFATLLASITTTPLSAEVIFDWATIGNPGNAHDIHGDGYGGVDYTYRISKTEVTNAQYVEFLNAVASSDPNNLYNPSMGSNTRGGIVRTGSSGNFSYAVKSPALGQGIGGSAYNYEDKPVNYVSFFDAMRFTNWLHNGQGNANTEIGSYSIVDGSSETRSANSQFWIPSEDEWYKAAYFDPNANVYHNFATGTDSNPDNNTPPSDTGNSANIFRFSNGGYATGNASYPLTDVASYSFSDSSYGTYDQTGNVNEMVESLPRAIRGGDFFDEFNIDAIVRGLIPPTHERSFIGFRVASAEILAVPEPSSALMLAAAMMITAVRRQSIA